MEEESLIERVVKLAGKIQAAAAKQGHRVTDDGAFIAAAQVLATLTIEALNKTSVN